ncbi:MAG: hypothetical protein H0U35_04515, partial [Sporichthyaceae bacterium]|nr:hypothetical protein [Sporichthyaceae bacterium]
MLNAAEVVIRDRAQQRLHLDRLEEADATRVLAGGWRSVDLGHRVRGQPAAPHPEGQQAVQEGELVGDGGNSQHAELRVHAGLDVVGGDLVHGPGAEERHQVAAQIALVV